MVDGHAISPSNMANTFVNGSFLAKSLLKAAQKDLTVGRLRLFQHPRALLETRNKVFEVAVPR